MPQRRARTPAKTRRRRYQSTFGKAPDYSDLIEQLATTPAERLLLLRGYFEPTEEERADGLKLPTEAHRAIARLAAAGYIRVIVTTNFDRLLEQALQAAGVTPTLVYTPDQVEGMLPIQHATGDGGVLVIKPHGDYLDTRLRNTAGELAAYEAPLRELLDRIFVEYGLVVCGWSGDWDLALRDCIERTTRHRFGTFWMARGGSLSEQARQIVQYRQAAVLSIDSADATFIDLEQRVAAVAEMQVAPPIDVRTAVALVKRYLPDERDAIRLDDVVMAEVKAVVEHLRTYQVGNVSWSDEMFRRDVGKMERYGQELCSAVIRRLVVQGCRFGFRRRTSRRRSRRRAACGR